MSILKGEHVCSAEFAGGLDNGLRRFLHNPVKIFKGLIRQGERVLDIGCGPGTFTIDLAAMVGEEGGVVAADLQEKMLKLMEAKVKGCGMSGWIRTHLCKKDTIGLDEEVDFINCFYMAHEVPDRERFFTELNRALRVGGRLFLVEPKVHVGKASFLKEVALAEKLGFKRGERRKVFFSRALILEKVFSI